MKKIILLIFLILVFVSNTIWAESSYKVYAQLSPREKIISGRVEVEYENNTQINLNEIYFYLPMNLYREKNPYLSNVLQDSSYVNGFDPGYTKINRVEDENGKMLEYTLEKGKVLSQNYSLKDNYLKVKLPNPIYPKERFKLIIYFQTKFPEAYFGDMAYANDAFLCRFGWFPYELSYTKDGWDKGGILVSSNFYLELLIPKDYQVALGMDKVQEEVAGDWKRIIGENTSPRRTLPIAISNKYMVYKLLDDKYPGIYIYHYPGREYKARILASYVREIYEYYSKLYGSTDHKRISIVEGQTYGFYGMASDGLIILGKSVFNSSDLVIPFILERLNEWILSHEIAHLWWGIDVGIDFDKENWISEGFANYLSITYFERKYGAKGGNLFPDLGDDYFLNFLKESLLGDLNLRETQVELPYLYYLKDGWDEEIIKEYWESNANGYSDKVYNKAYLVLRALSFELGEENFDEYIKSLHGEYKGKVITTDEVKDKLEKYSGKSLGEFFKNWFYSKGRVDYEITNVAISYNNGKYVSKIYIRNNGNISLPVEVKVIAKNGEEKKEIYDGNKGYIEIETENFLERVVLDPDSKIPDANRINNWYPRKIITTSKREVPLDAYVFLYQVLPSLSIDLSTGEVNYVSYSVKFYDPINFHLLFESFYQEGYKGLNFVYQRNLPKDDNFVLQLIAMEPDIFMGKLSFTKNIWRKFDLGISGNYWDKAYTMNFSLSYNELLNNKLYFDFVLTRFTDYYKKALLSQLSLRIGYSNLGFEVYRVDGILSKDFLVFPQSNLNISFEVGYVGGNPLQEEKVNLSDFKSLTSEYYGNVKLASFVNWNIPVAKDLEMKFFNLLILRRLETNVYLEFGGVWEDVNSIDKAGLNLGLGFESVWKFITFLDIPLNLYMGYAFPIWQGTPNPNETGRAYSYLTLGF